MRGLNDCSGLKATVGVGVPEMRKAQEQARNAKVVCHWSVGHWPLVTAASACGEGWPPNVWSTTKPASGMSNKVCK